MEAFWTMFQPFLVIFVFAVLVFGMMYVFFNLPEEPFGKGKLNVYYAYGFEGCSYVVVAENPKRASQVLNERLQYQFFSWRSKVEDMHVLDMSKEKALIMDYLSMQDRL